MPHRVGFWAARLVDVPPPYAWVRWQYFWDIPRRGEYQMRAGDDQDRIQPGEPSVARIDE